jgi:hypothetical protein
VLVRVAVRAAKVEPAPAAEPREPDALLAREAPRGALLRRRRQRRQGAGGQRRHVRRKAGRGAAERLRQGGQRGKRVSEPVRPGQSGS